MPPIDRALLYTAAHYLRPHMLVVPHSGRVTHQPELGLIDANLSETPVADIYRYGAAGPSLPASSVYRNRLASKVNWLRTATAEAALSQIGSARAATPTLYAD
jgi:hypothetical protein